MGSKSKKQNQELPEHVIEGVHHSIAQANAGELRSYTGIRNMLELPFDFLNDEEDLYTEEDIKEPYVRK